MNDAETKRIIEVALLTAEYPLPLEEIVELLATDTMLDEQNSRTHGATAQLSAQAFVEPPTIVQTPAGDVASVQAAPSAEPSAVEFDAQVPAVENSADDQPLDAGGAQNGGNDESTSPSDAEPPSPREIRARLRDRVRIALGALAHECAERGVDLVEVASGYRYQVKASHSHWVSRLHAERPTRYSRALLETLALVAYRQPVTRGEIEDIRGVGVSSSIMKTLHEREWIRVLGHREVPGRPAMYGTTRKFLDDFNLQRLDQLPPLAEIRELENLHADLFPSGGPGNGNVAGEPASSSAQNSDQDSIQGPDDGTGSAPQSQLRIAVGPSQDGDEAASAEPEAAQSSDEQEDAPKSDSPKSDSPEPDSPEPDSPEPDRLETPSLGLDKDSSEDISQPSSPDDISPIHAASAPPGSNMASGMSSSFEPTSPQAEEHSQETLPEGERRDAPAEAAPISQSPEANVRANTGDEQSPLTPGTDADPTSNAR